MFEQLLLSKRLFVIGAGYADGDDPVSAGLAISLFQDAVEIFIWSLLKNLDAQAKEKAPFTSFFDLVVNAPNNSQRKSLPLKAKMLELNTARVNFKHYGNLPAPSEARKFRAYCEQFLVLSFLEFHEIDFDLLSLVDLVRFPEVREKLKNAEEKCLGRDFSGSMEECAIARSILFSNLEEFFPMVDRSLANGDRIFQQIPGMAQFEYFSKIAEYLRRTRESNIIAMLGVPMRDYIALQKFFPAALLMSSGEWILQQHDKKPEPDETVAQMAVQMITNLSLKAQDILGNA